MIGGNNVYFGKIIEKPTIGDPIKELEAVDIHDTIRIVYASSLVTLFILNNYGSLKDTLLKIKDEGRTDKIKQIYKIVNGGPYS